MKEEADTTEVKLGSVILKYAPNNVPFHRHTYWKHRRQRGGYLSKHQHLRRFLTGINTDVFKTYRKVSN